MIDLEKQLEIENVIRNDKRFIDLTNEMLDYTGKEAGHTFASKFEDTIVDILVDKYENCDIPRNPKTGKKLARALGDLVLDNNLINIKSGDEKMGQPNMCSMNRIMKEFVLESNIDSYSIIKFKVIDGKPSLTVFDMFDVIDILNWDAGTGQIMLSEKKFYDVYDENAEKLSLTEKKRKIYELYDKGIEANIQLRIKQRMDMATKVNESLKNQN